MKTHYAIVIHGGAGTLLKTNYSDHLEAKYHGKLEESLDTAYEILATGGTSLDAVESAIRIMENSPLFNAGKGSVFTHEGDHELDASIMEGKALQAGAVVGVSTLKNPIMAARQIMEKSDHVILSGTGAEAFADQNGLELVDANYFFTQEKYDQLQEIRHTGHTQLDHAGESISAQQDSKFGTVGAVALDQHGNIVAGTSTGGMTNKRFGRVGDSPLIGAGTYANNHTCGVSCTGHGEYFIRKVVAYDVAALMEYNSMTVAEAAHEVIQVKMLDFGGSGGLIALDKAGNITMPFNTKGMYRGYRKAGEAAVVAIFDE